MRRHFFCTVAAAALVVCAGPAVLAQAPALAAFPTGPVRYVVPAPPGGLIDTMARLVSQGLTDRLKQSVIIDNKPGANTVLGADLVAKSSPDGLTWLAVSSTLAANAGLPGATFDSEKLLQPVVRLAVTPMGVVVPAHSPYKTFQDLLKAAKGGKVLNVGSSGNGTPPHLALALFQSATGTELTHIPYKGGSPSLVDLIGGQIDVVFSTLSESQGFIKGGKLRVLAVMSDKRLAEYPDVPTTAEAGLPGLLMAGWTGIMVPRATPRATVQKIADAALAVTREPAFVKQAETMGFVVAPQGPAEFDKFYRDEVGRMRVLIKAQNIRMD